MAYKKTKAVYFKGQTLNVGDSNIDNIVILQAGQDKTGENFDRISLDQLVVLGNAQGQGVKCRFGHPNLCDSALGTYLGRYKNFAVSTNADGKEVVVANLLLDDVASRSPHGNLKDYVIEMARKNSDMFGNSIAYDPADPEYIIEKDALGNDVEVAYERINAFMASDLVDSPAATDNLFKDDTDFAALVTEFLDANPKIFDVVLKDESVIKKFLDKYNHYKNLKKMTIVKKTKSLKEQLADGLKALATQLGGETKKSVDATTADGKTVTISDEDGDGKAGPGDTVTVDGQPAISMTLAMGDGTTITTDESGIITDVKEVAAPAPAPAKSVNVVETKEYKDLKKLYDAQTAEVAKVKADNEKANKAGLKQVEALTKQLETLTSDGDVEGSSEADENFNGKNKKKAVTKSLEERKAEIKNANRKTRTEEK